MSSMSNSIARILWWQKEIDFSISSLKGLSKGLIILWKVSSVEVLCRFHGEGFLGFKVRWEDSLYYIINVYSACSFSMRHALWNTLLDLKSKFKNGEWVIGGEFNTVKNCRERMGRNVQSYMSEWREFSVFIDDNGLVAILCKGKKYSWNIGDGKEKIRINRFLVDDNIVSRWRWLANSLALEACLIIALYG